MVDLKRIEEYILANGVPVTRPIYADGQRLRVMDLTALPGAMRGHFDERGFYKDPTQESPQEAPLEQPQPKTKGGKK